jgi:hypothetical protein
MMDNYRNIGMVSDSRLKLQIPAHCCQIKHVFFG